MDKVKKAALDCDGSKAAGPMDSHLVSTKQLIYCHHYLISNHPALYLILLQYNMTYL
ncbi:hypothetical protein NC653_038273 [Populus alba x Populus x berolinensis]|uniref:Uncharacterized protein n=1 Tax=Populus alba x Populus x berolinensis TaxID=444605 RepID=A0AAD6LGP1_9ROSI|nr:hypothetical protein NC653_038273 [Populus alba x Populus x berolinensis]